MKLLHTKKNQPQQQQSSEILQSSSNAQFVGLHMKMAQKCQVAQSIADSFFFFLPGT